MDHINQTFADLDQKSLFAGVGTKKLLDSFTENEAGMVFPTKLMFVQDTPKRIWVHGLLKEVEKNCTIVSFLENLEKLIARPDVLHCIQHPIVSDDNVYRDYHDGSFVKNHPILSDPRALAIVLYYDELEVANPLGSFAKKHKLGMFYWSLANIYPKFRSSKRAIQLYAIATHEDIDDNIEQILHNFIIAIKKLEQGVTFYIRGEEYFFKSYFASGKW